ncbi:trehalose ABC transporter permease SugB [Aeromicrobium panaciterrae]|uniref:carbohydrate ABC transporter permease n=1 Tax=Aeromicrobium panaciterrae TaxID=363861 RepID=UPI0031DDE9BF
MSERTMSNVALVPSVRSRLWASGISFVLGFAVANYGILMISKPDQWVWLGVAILLMLTGAAGILFADTNKSVSFWAVLGIEVFLVFTLLPLLWTFTVATTPSELTATSLWPDEVTWSAFSDVLGSDELRRAALTSALVSGVATLVSVPLAIGASYALVRVKTRGRRVVYALVIAALLMPLVALTGPIADQVIAFDRYGSRWALVPAALLITLPLSIWLLVTVFKRAPWSLGDAVRADGATRRQWLVRFVVPAFAPGILVVTLLVFVVGCQDYVLGAALSTTDAPLPASLLMARGDLESSSATIAAVGLLWAIVPAMLLLVAPRRIHQLLGRSYR